MHVVPYTAKLSSGKTFVVFTVFPLNHLLCTAHDGYGLMHHESFPVNNVFCAQPQKFSHSKVLLCTVCFEMRSSVIFLNFKIYIATYTFKLNNIPFSL